MARVLILLFLFAFFGGIYARDTSSLASAINSTEAKDPWDYQQEAKEEKNQAPSSALLNKAQQSSTPNLAANRGADLRVDSAAALLKAGNIRQAFSELLTAEKIYDKTGNKVSRAHVLILMAKFFEQNAAWNDAVNHYNSAKKLLADVKNFKSSAKVSLQLTEISLSQNNLGNATENVLTAIKQYEKLNDKAGLGLSYVKFAEIYRRKKQYKKAEKLILKNALPYLSRAGSRAGRIKCFDVLGKVYYNQKRYSEAKWFFIQANTESRNVNDVESIISSLVNLGKVKIDIGDFDLAKRDLKEAKSLASELKNLFLMANVEEAFSVFYKKTGSQSRSESVNDYSSELRDSLANYFFARAESARTAKPIELPKLVIEKKIPASPVKKDFWMVKILAAGLVLILLIFLILRKLK
ncbi:hypothetical protein WG906_16320 [Pedobacter sp. P351]|uniref:tetratricopeptide repeat protein n=1 Tax=Pedobacter superstes TaxID=3133441 RepID=UPI0030AA2462